MMESMKPSRRPARIALALLLLLAPAAAAAPGTLEVRVLEHGGEPVVGAWVTVPGKARAFTGPGGRVRLTDLPSADVDVLVERAVAPGKAYERIGAGPFPADGRVIEVRFPDRPVLEGRVLDPEGGPAAFLEVVAVDAAGVHVSGGTTDTRGRFELRLPGEGPFDLHVSGIRYASKPGERPAVLPLAGHADGVRAGDEPVIRTEKVSRDRTVTVRVLSPDGEPIPRASVSALGWAAREYGVAGEDGRAGLSGLPDREVTLGATLPPLDGEETWVAPEPVALVPDGQEVDLRARVGVVVRGVVVDGEGAPVAGAGVRLPGYDSATTDSEGRFAVAGLPGEATPLHAYDPGGSDRRPREATIPEVIPGKSGDLKVVLRPVGIGK